MCGACHQASSQARKLSALRRVYGFLYGEGVRSDDPVALWLHRAYPGRCQKILSAEEARSSRSGSRRRDELRRRPSALHCRNALRSGLRISELVALPLASIRTRERFIHVRGKGGRERLAP
jgi:integrase/recombinase XerD